jgi:hypothetical protein
VKTDKAGNLRHVGAPGASLLGACGRGYLGATLTGPPLASKMTAIGCEMPPIMR